METKQSQSSNKTASATAAVKPNEEASVKASGPKKLVTDLEAMFAKIQGRTSGGGVKIDPRRAYTINPEKLVTFLQNAKSVPIQERVILSLLCEVLTEEKTHIMEPELKTLIEAAKAKGTLKTGQDAWHIFRYYRTDLMKNDVIRSSQVEPPAAEVPATESAAVAS